MTERNSKILKVGLVWATLLVFTKVYAQKGGYKGLSITNKSEGLQKLFETFKNNDWDKWLSTSGYFEANGWVKMDFPTPFGNMSQKFFEDGKYELVKFDGQKYDGVWSGDGTINISGLGMYNEGDISITAMGLNTALA
jgi:hypothetical protein